MLRSFKADLHVHTVLSPCADLLMTPGNIIQKALERELDIIAITDHNSAENVRVTMELARNTPLNIIPGMEVESAEEVHLLCLFEKLEQVLTWQKIVYKELPELENDEEFFGYQILTDVDDKYRAKVDRLLATAIGLTTDEIVSKVLEIGGLVIPAHIDRVHNSIISNLGFIPSDLDLPLLEISRRCDRNIILNKYPSLINHNLIKSSDSHFLDDIAPVMELLIEEVALKELILAAGCRQGRELFILDKHLS